jgi:hypothetical protein
MAALSTLQIERVGRTHESANMQTHPFLGSEALASGRLNRHQLRTRFTAIFPDVYLSRQMSQVPLDVRTAAAWLWSGGNGVIAGQAAAALHGAKWIDDDIPIELIHNASRSPSGIITRRFTLAADECAVRHGIAVTTPQRTAFDVGRRGDLGSAVACLDSLSRATRLTASDVEAVAGRHPGSPGLRLLESALELVDAGAQSPRETALRLLLIRAGIPRPTTQIPVVVDGRPIAYLDMGWEQWMVAVEYDGDQHRTDRWQYVKDIRRVEMLERMGWIIIRVVAEDRPSDVNRRVRAALDLRRSTVH